MSDRVHQLFKVLTVAAAFMFIFMYVVVALRRMSYPYPLEWLEGGCVDMVRQVLSSEPLYMAPSISYIPFVYAPLYFYVSAAFTQVLGVSFLPLRLVSFVSSLGCFVLLYAIVRRETNSHTAGILSAGVFAATYVWTGGWFDLARVDSLFLFLMLAAVYVLRGGNNTRTMLAAAALFWLSFLTKQIALTIAVPFVAYLAFVDRRKAIVFGATFLGLAGISTAILDLAYDGWYTYYVFQLPGQHPLLPEKLLGFWIADIAAPLFVASALTAGLIVAAWRDHDRRQALFYIALSIGTLGTAWGSRLHEGGYSNVLMPAYAALAILSSIAVARVPGFVRLQPRLSTKALSAMLLSLSLLQFGGLAYNPLWMLPSAEERAASDQMMNIMREAKGEVFAPAHGYTPTLVGKRTYAHTVAIWDILRGDHGIIRAGLIGELRGLMRAQQFDLLIIESPTFVLPDLPQYYALSESLPPGFESETIMWPQSMKVVRPEGVYRPKTESE